MKKLIFTLGFILLVVFNSLAQTTINISGTLTNLANNAPVPNHIVTVFITDSVNYTFQQNYTTNSSGYYAATIQNVPSTGLLIYVSTADCNNLFQYQFLATSPYVANFSICVGTPPTCQASYTASSSPINPLIVNFTDLTVGNPTSWLWDFGDNTSSTLQNPVHTYSQNGIYVVTLSVYCGNTFSTYTDTLVLSGGTITCQANFSYFPDSVSPLLVHFIDQSIGNPTSYYWNFGDNTSSTLQNPSHNYALAGTYTVTLTISGTNCQNTTSTTITIGGSTNCQAGFIASPSTLNPLTFIFTDQSSGNPSSWLWDFGDNTSSTLQNPTHTYAQNGLYVVSLVVFCNNTFSTYTDTINVGGGTPGCQAIFTYAPNSSNPLLINFMDQSTGNPTSFQWNFGDGSSSSMQNPSHLYAQSGTYNVTFLIFGSGCQSTTTQTINVSNNTPTTGNVFGYVNCGNNFADYGLVFLVEFDSNTNMLTAIDTTAIDSAGFYLFTNVPFGHYLIKAALTPNSAYYNSYFPTYFGNQLFWYNAATITFTPVGLGYNISLIPGNNPGGPGFVGGNVLNGANKGSEDPVENAIVLLLDLSKNPVAVDFSDISGVFEFNNVAYGTYLVYIDVPGKTTIPMQITVNASNPSVSDIIIVINSTIISSLNKIVPGKSDANVGEVYPNPAYHNSYIELYNNKAVNVKVSVLNSLGQLISIKNLNLMPGSNTIDIPVQHLENGLYTVKIESVVGQVYRRFLKLAR